MMASANDVHMQSFSKVFHQSGLYILWNSGMPVISSQLTFLSFSKILGQGLKISALRYPFKNKSQGLI